MIAGQVSKPLLSLRSEMNAELRGEDKAATSDNELNEPLLAPVESNDSEDTPSKLFVTKQVNAAAPQSQKYQYELG
ncbi:POU domain, class 6, transcription factor 2 [Grus japonensis]|uniref:POU domain, class 6, transcription factor 2 n=1 Tax=Grus japonensis TaxID=30415 RepID=A0ABC9WFV4_GRUJA